MGIAYSGGINVWTEFDGSTRPKFVNGFADTLLRAGWVLEERVKAFVSHAYDPISGNPSAGTTLNVGGLNYNWVTTINQSNPREVLHGATTAESLDNMINAIAADPFTVGTAYSTATIVHPLMRAYRVATTLFLQAKTGGPYGSGLTTTFGVTVGGGYKLIGSSPQTQTTDPDLLLQVRCYVHDSQVTSSTVKQASISLISTTDDDVNAPKVVSVVADRKYRMIANRCQYFCYVVGIAADPKGSVLCGGIPFVPGAGTCTGEAVGGRIDEIFWHSCDAGLVEFATPRTMVAHRLHVTETDGSDPNQNDTDTISDAAGGWSGSHGVLNGESVTGLAHGTFRMVSMTPSEDWPDALTGGANVVGSVMWADEKPLTLEPFVSWGPTDDSDDPAIYGQLYDGVIKTVQEDMDTTREFLGKKWVAFTNRYKFGTLWLMVPELTPVGLSSKASYAY